MFIVDSNWYVPDCVSNIFPIIPTILNKVTIPLIEKNDQLVWKHSQNGELSFRDAYLFHSPTTQNVSWAKLIWHKNIPPSKSLMLWRCLLNKLPTDDSLSARGCQVTSMCSLCSNSGETLQHLFMDCTFAKRIWNWLSSIIKVPCNFTSVLDFVEVCNRGWSPLCKLITLAAVTYCFNLIWYCRNQKRFADKIVNARTAINLIISGTSLSANSSSLKAFSSISDFVILRAFSVKMNYGNAPKIIEVLWHPPIMQWLKCNIDGASKGNPGPSACGGIFRNSTADFMGAFAFSLGISNSLFAELQGAMIAIEIASQKGWKYLWLETDSIIVTLAFKSSKTVPWQLRNRWENCLLKTSAMNFYVIHVYREGNQCADLLANIGLSLQTHAWWDQVPNQIGAEFTKDRLGLSNYRFC